MTGWPTEPLGDLCNIAPGGTPSRARADFYNGGIPWVKIGDMLQGRVTRTEETISQLGLECSAAKLLPPQTVLISIFATIGRTAVLDVEAATNQAIVGVTPKNTRQLTPPFLRYFLDHSVARLAGQARGVAQLNINGKILKSLPVPVPPLPEQQRLVSLLDQADALRKLRTQADRRIGELIPAVFHEMFGVPFTNHVAYPVKKLRELVREDDKINYGVVQPGDEVTDGIPIVRAGDFSGMSINRQYLKRISAAVENSYSRSRLRGDELLITCVGSIGNVALADPALAGFNIVRAVARVPLRDEVDRVFVANQLMTPELQNFFRQETRTVAQPTLNIGQIEETPIILPPLALQKKFAQRVTEFRELETEQAKSRKRIDDLFQSMLHGAFSGEL